MADTLGCALLMLARSSIAAELGVPATPVDLAGCAQCDALDRPGATFVTLKIDDDLRGCIGTLEPVRVLRVDVQQNAVRAAFSDPRFPPLHTHEFDQLAIEVSLIGRSEPMRVRDEDDLLAQLRPDVDGLILGYGHRRGTFLPQVWESLPEPRSFVRELKRKAGLPADFWHPDLQISRYTVDKWTEQDVLAR